MRTFSSEIPVRGFFPHLQSYLARPERIYGSSGNDVRRVGNIATRTTRFKTYNYSKVQSNIFQDFSAAPININNTHTTTYTHTPWTGSDIYISYVSCPFLYSYSSDYVCGSQDRAILNTYSDHNVNSEVGENYGCFFDTSHVPMNFNPSTSFCMTASVRGVYDADKFEDIGTAQYPNLNIGAGVSLNSVFASSSTALDVSLNVTLNTGITTEVYLLNYTDYLYLLSLPSSAYDNTTMAGRTSPEIHSMADGVGCQYWGVFVIRHPIVLTTTIVSTANFTSTAYGPETNSQYNTTSRVGIGVNVNAATGNGTRYALGSHLYYLPPFGGFGTDEINLAP